MIWLSESKAWKTDDEEQSAFILTCQVDQLREAYQLGEDRALCSPLAMQRSRALPIVYFSGQKARWQLLESLNADYDFEMPSAKTAESTNLQVLTEAPDAAPAAEPACKG